MNNTLRRLISAVLLSTTVLSLAACASDNGTAAQTTADTTVSASAETTEETTTAAETKPAVQVPDLPSKDWEGRRAMFLVKGPGQGNWESKEIWVPEENGEVVNDAVYARNLKMEERYNFKVAITGGDSLDSMARTVILAGDDDYDVVMPNMTQSANLANEKLTFDLYDVPYIDLDRDYYDQNSIRDLTIGGRLYFVTGEIAYQDQDGIWVTMFNKELAESYGIDDPYKLVRDGTWTVDRLIEMTSDVSRDIDGDGKMGITDMWGFVSAYSTVSSMVYGADIRIVTKNEKDLPELTFDHERIHTVLEKAITLLETEDRSFMVDHFPGMGYNAYTLRDVFGGGLGLFYAEVLMHVKTMRWSNVTFGVVPFPKYDETIEGYPHFINAVGTMVNIPTTVADPEFSGFVVEAMSAEAMNLITPAYYDVALTGKYMRDDESAEMLDLIIGSAVYDLGHIFAWGGLSTSFTNLVKAKSTDFASMYQSSSTSAQAQIDKFIELHK